MTSSPDHDTFAGAPDAVVDARGLRCPLPVIRLAAHARSAEGVEVVEVLATDPAARSDIPAWCRLRGQEYLGAIDRAAEVAEVADGAPGGHTAYRVRITPVDAEGRTAAGAAAAPPGGAPGTPAG